ncbi:MAG: NAD(P)/FAD-dependent oxidoreductase [Proteobacteria bacterium]|nr:NAD(P)/FAD-dependent oxidoreductase [Pseudomonadota bacterium]
MTRCEFSDGRWRIRTSLGREDEAHVIIAATGVLHHPHVAELPGLERFAGACFHSARWDHSVALAGKRVGVVGTGSTAIQITTALAGKVGHFSLFQRTAQWVMPMDDRPYTDAERAAFRADARKLYDLRAQLDTDFQLGAQAVIDAESDKMKRVEAYCLANLENNVEDPELRERFASQLPRRLQAPDLLAQFL